MRAAPLGLFFLRNQYKLKEATYGASAITHDHPLAKEGALIITFSVASALKDESNEKLLEALAGIVRLPEYKLKLDSIRSLLGTEASAEDIVDELGNTVEALESVPAALYAFLKYGDDFMKTVGFCISMGGDTDTISAMAGSLSGARVGLEGLPGELTSRLEDRERLGDLAIALYESAMKASA
jgi:poly(ADP-ribose) glycohydrolase ARH3